MALLGVSNEFLRVARVFSLPWHGHDVCFYSGAMRFAAVCLGVLLLGLACSDGAQDRGGATADSPGTESDEGSAPPSGAGDAAAACQVDSDCEAVASSCCECPTFALPFDDGVGGVCEDVMCDEPLACPAQEAVCGASGECELACSEIACELSCADGFVLDEADCAVCACAPATAEPECTGDDDCVQVVSDCCGCSRGGVDTAVPADEASSFQDGLGCTGDEVCPEVDVCDPDEIAVCSFGRCVLAVPELDPDDGGVEVCGTSDVPTCPEGSVCVLNPREHPMVAVAGLGVCEPL